MMKAC
ncbi:hypothetical protein VCHENC02_3033A, partial [Vibrio harveyi]